MTINFDTLVLAPCFSTFTETNQGYPAIVYMPANSGRFIITGIFDPAYKEVKFKEGEPVTVQSPVLGCRASDFIVPPLQDDQVQIRGLVYKVREVRIDGHGGIKLMLNAVKI